MRIHSCDAARRRHWMTLLTAVSMTWWSLSTRWTSIAHSSFCAPTSASACRRLVSSEPNLCSLKQANCNYWIVANLIPLLATDWEVHDAHLQIRWPPQPSVTAGAPVCQEVYSDWDWHLPQLFVSACQTSWFWWEPTSCVSSGTSCAEIMEKHLEQSVLSKLPYGYDSVTRQSLSSTEDDMGIDPSLDLPNYGVPCRGVVLLWCLQLQSLHICIGCWMLKVGTRSHLWGI